MRLMSAVVGFVLRKLGLLTALVLSLFLVLLLKEFLIPPVSEAVAARDRLPRVETERAALQEDLEQLRSKAAEAQREANASLQGRIVATRSQLEDARDKEDDLCGLVKKAIDALTSGRACETAQKAVEELDDAVTALENGLGRTEDTALTKEINDKEKELDRKKAEEEDLNQAKASPLGRVVDQWAKRWGTLVAIGLLVVFMPYALRSVSYFLLMPMVRRAHKPIHLAAGSDDGNADLRTTAASGP